jgi:hypothetical protein
MATSRDGGDRVFHGDKVSYERAQHIDPGMLVVPSDDMVVDKADVSGAGTGVVGVMTDANMASGEDEGNYGDKYTVIDEGIVKVRAESGVSAGDELAVPDSGGTGATTPGVAGSGGDTGYIAVRGAEQEPDGNHYVLAKLD